jgi:hypothetical protein
MQRTGPDDDGERCEGARGVALKHIPRGGVVRFKL